MKFQLTLAGVLLLLSCHQKTTPEQVDPTTTSVNQDSLTMIQALLPSNLVYVAHFMNDFNQDAIPDLLITSRSSKRSDCHAPLYDTLCHYMNVRLYELQHNQWTLTSEQFIQDIERTTIAIDVSNNLQITIHQRYSGYSSGEVVETYTFNNGTFLMHALTATIYTKSGPEFYQWEYVLNLEENKGTLNWNTTVFEEDYESSQDSTLSFTLPTFKIPLGTSYDLDTLLPSDVQFYFH